MATTRELQLYGRTFSLDGSIDLDREDMLDIDDLQDFLDQRERDNESLELEADELVVAINTLAGTYQHYQAIRIILRKTNTDHEEVSQLDRNAIIWTLLNRLNTYLADDKNKAFEEITKKIFSILANKGWKFTPDIDQLHSLFRGDFHDTLTTPLPWTASFLGSNLCPIDTIFSTTNDADKAELLINSEGAFSTWLLQHNTYSTEFLESVSQSDKQIIDIDICLMAHYILTGKFDEIRHHASLTNPEIDWREWFNTLHPLLATTPGAGEYKVNVPPTETSIPYLFRFLEAIDLRDTGMQDIEARITTREFITLNIAWLLSPDTDKKAIREHSVDAFFTRFGFNKNFNYEHYCNMEPEIKVEFQQTMNAFMEGPMIKWALRRDGAPKIDGEGKTYTQFLTLNDNIEQDKTVGIRTSLSNRATVTASRFRRDSDAQPEEKAQDLDVPTLHELPGYSFDKPAELILFGHNITINGKHSADELLKAIDLRDHIEATELCDAICHLLNERDTYLLGLMLGKINQNRKTGRVFFDFTQLSSRLINEVTMRVLHAHPHKYDFSLLNKRLFFYRLMLIHLKETGWQFIPSLSQFYELIDDVGRDTFYMALQYSPQMEKAVDCANDADWRYWLKRSVELQDHNKVTWLLKHHHYSPEFVAQLHEHSLQKLSRRESYEKEYLNKLIFYVTAHHAITGNFEALQHLKYGPDPLYAEPTINNNLETVLQVILQSRENGSELSDSLSESLDLKQEQLPIVAQLYMRITWCCALDGFQYSTWSNEEDTYPLREKMRQVVANGQLDELNMAWTLLGFNKKVSHPSKPINTKKIQEIIIDAFFQHHGMNNAFSYTQYSALEEDEKAKLEEDLEVFMEYPMVKYAISSEEIDEAYQRYEELMGKINSERNPGLITNLLATVGALPNRRTQPTSTNCETHSHRSASDCSSH